MRSVNATRHSLITPYLAGTIWYDEENQWVRGAFEHDGETIYTLANVYTRDRGHLNEARRRVAAAAFLDAVADALVADSER